jgi:hypothetical protein
MGLSVFQKFAIAGGEAARIVRETENKRMDGIKNALFKSIEDSAAPASEYRQKHLLVKNKAKEDLQNIMSQYLPEDLDLTQTDRVAAAQALYAKHGYDPEKINKAYQNKVAASQKLGSLGYNRKSFLNDEFQDIKSINSDMNIDKISTIIAQNKVGAAPRNLDVSMQVLKSMPQSRGIVTDPINVEDIGAKAKAALGLPEVVEGELPKIAMKPKYDHNKTLDEVQKYRLNESTIQKNKAALEKTTTWKPSDWRNSYKDFANIAAKATKLDLKVVPNPTGGFDFTFPGGEKNDAIKREVERNSLRNFVMFGAGANKLNDPAFRAVVQGAGANVVGLSKPDEGEQMIPGMTYTKSNGQRVVFTGQKDADGKFINIPLLSGQPVYN